MNNGQTFELTGLRELSSDCKKVLQRYPDASIKEMKTFGKEFKKKVISETPDSGQRHRGKLNKGFSVAVKGSYLDQRLELSSNAPHYHLVEYGHEVVPRGKGKKRTREDAVKKQRLRPGNRGVVHGRYMVARTAPDFRERFPKVIEDFTDKMLREENL